MVIVLLPSIQVIQRCLGVLGVARAAHRRPGGPGPLAGAEWAFFSIIKAEGVLTAWTLGTFL